MNLTKEEYLTCVGAIHARRECFDSFKAILARLGVVSYDQRIEFHNELKRQIGLHSITADELSLALSAADTQLEVVATHESGHWLVAHALGWSPGDLLARPGEGSAFLGHKHPPGLEGASLVMHFIAISWGGIVAEEIVGFPGDVAGAASDFAAIERGLEMLQSESRTEARESGRKLAEQLLLDRHATLLGLAAALKVRGTLTADESLAVVTNLA